jgi:hypothetical protein
LSKGNQGGIMDYFKFGPDVLPPLKENGGLDENNGFGAGPAADGYGTTYWCNNGGLQVLVTNLRKTPIDWNCNLNFGDTEVTEDLNKDSQFEPLTSENEWTHLTYTGGAIGNFGVPYNPPETITFTPENHELTIEEARAILPIPVLAPFEDVPRFHWANSFIQRLYAAGITGGCSTAPLLYCPDGVVTRVQMAVFLVRGIHGVTYTPPDVGNNTGFGDVTPGYWAAAYIKQLAADGVTAGCGNGNYCPENPVTRAQMAVFLLRAKHGVSYTPSDVAMCPYSTGRRPSSSSW